MNVAEPVAAGRVGSLDIERIRADFPALHQQVHGKPLVYLDSAATALKPQAVIDAVVRMYALDCSNVHRAVHTLSQRATQAFESARGKVARFLGAPSAESIVFVRGVTEAMNLLAHGWGRKFLRVGDEILLTGLEHHSNIVPWQMLAKERGATIVVAPVDDRGVVPLEEIERRLSPRTRLLATAHVSNSLGTIQPVEQIVALAKAHGALVAIDGAQAAPHLPVDVAEIGCDFYTFSGHKLYGPTGIGVLWGRPELLDAMDPFQGGGDMIRDVSFEETTYSIVPHKFEAGTPHIAGAVGLGAAVDYLSAIGMATVRAHEKGLVAFGTELLEAVPGLRLIGTAPDKVGVFQFVVDWAHPTDVGTLVDLEGVAIRTGHHCTQPLMSRYGVTATARASLGIYNDEADLRCLVDALATARTTLS
jgi:cysteine desulfurase/selenocysteine lyase